MTQPEEEILYKNNIDSVWIGSYQYELKTMITNPQFPDKLKAVKKKKKKL